MADPFSTVYDALWAALEGHAGFTALVPVGNRIKFNKPDPIKAEVSTQDLPEVRLLPASFAGNLPITSNSSRVQHQFEVQIATGSQQVKGKLFPVAWEVIRALSKWQSHLTGLTWDAGKVIRVTNVRTFSAREGVLYQDLNRGIIGWSLNMTIDVDMFFQSSDVQAA